MPVRTRLVALLLFGSGFCALIYQTTWLREFRLIFGASTAATAAVLGVFMSGIGIGGILLGRRSDTKARPLAFYAQLELLIAISAALSPLLIFAARQLYIALGGTQAMGVLVGTIIRLVLAALIIGTPTFLMGGTLPAAARAAVAPDDLERRSIGILYGANTLGAVTGAAIGTFYCFENFGNRLTLWLAAVLNVLIALSAFYLSKSTPEFKSLSKLSRELAKTERQTQVGTAFVFSAAALVGFTFFLMELVWYRMLGPLLGGSTFSFGLILTVALFGIGLGGAAYALFGLRRPASLHFFAVTCAAEALAIAIPYALGDGIATAAMLLWPLGILGFYGHIVAWTALCLIVIFPAAFIAGVQFPVLIALLGKGRKNVGSQTGAAYACNTIGALIGSLAGGFGFIPLFSAPGVWRMVTVVLAALALIAVGLALRESKRWLGTIVPVISVVLALVMLRATGPTAFWRHSQIGVGRVTRYQGSPNEMRDLANSIRRSIAWDVDGRESSVALAKADSFAFIVNGRTDGSTKGDAGTQIMSGLIGAALHPHAAKAMVVGLGTGSTAGWLADVPNIKRVDVVELEPAILRVAEKCAPINRDALHNPKLHVTIGDARETLLTTREKYDIVVSEPSNPYRAGVAGLFTREYYQSVDRCLQPDGMFFQWVQAYDIDDRTMQIFYRTLGSVFANIESWQTETGDLLLLASHEPILYDADALRARLAEEPFKSALSAAWRGTSLEAFLAHYIGSRAVAAALIRMAAGPLNTDDRTVIEFAFARSVKLTGGFQIGNLRASASGAHADRAQFIKGEVDWALVDEERLSMYPSLNRAAQLQATLTPQQKSRAAAFVSYADGDLPAALRQWREQSEEPRTLAQLQLVSECLASEGDSSVLPYIEKLADILPRDAEAVRAEYLWRDRRPQEATESLEKFLRALHEDPWPSSELIQRSMARAEAIARSDRSKIAARLLYDALATPFCVFINESNRLDVLLGIGIYLDDDHPGEHALAVLEAFEPYVLWQRKFLQVRKDSYLAQHSPRVGQATRDFDEFMKHESSTADVFGLTKEIEARALDTSSIPNSSQSEATTIRQ
jgi:spermidine synthase/predicted MFS family arabinose efflux permease